MIKKDHICNNNFERNLRLISKNYDCIAIKCIDKNEQVFPNVGFIELCDIENNQI